MPVYTYNEESGDLSPSGATFTNRSQTCAGTYTFENPTVAQLQGSIVDLLGYTDTRVSDGRIRRTLPTRHPTWPWLFVDSCSPQGVGKDFSTQTPAQGRGSPIIPQYPLYATYHYRVTFSNPPYNMWQDRDIQVVKGQTAYDKDGNSYTYAYATEWYRFTELIQQPANNFISAQQGQMVFRASGSGGAAQPDSISFQDSPRMYLPDSVVTLRWHQVPYRYVTSQNSYLTKFVGHINQSKFGYIAKGGTLEPYAAGSLLYVGARVLQIYTPPIPDEGILAFNFGDGFQRGKLCDLELNFLYTARTIGSATGNTPDMSGVNRNWIVGGWNLLPWLTTRKFYYATTYDPASPTTQSSWRPSYNSFPFPLFFTDPDAGASPSLDP